MQEMPAYVPLRASCCLCPAPVAVERYEVGYAHLSRKPDQGLDLIEIIVHHNGDHMHALIAVHACPGQHFQPRAGALEGPRHSPLLVVLCRVDVIDGNARLIETR